MIIRQPLSSREPLVLAEPDYPFWGFAEVLAIGAIAVPSLLIGFTLVNSAEKTWRFTLAQGIVSVLAQSVGYAIMFAALWLFFELKGRPLLSSLGWVKHPVATGPLIATGVLLAIAVVAMTLVLRTPNIETPLQKLLNDKPTKLLVGIFGVSMGPAVEELLFRGFLQPVMMRVAGVLPGILITAVLFGLLHSEQYARQWQLVLSITLVGFVLGIVKHLSGSTKASAVVHISYNSVFFLAMLAAGDQVPHK